jgi:hypothetical protein
LAWFKEGVLDYVYIIDINETCIRRQKMKLYTEADLKKVISIYSEEYKTSTDEILKELNLTPIEIPNDEEIDKEIEWLDNPLERLNFKAGIKWMRDKIRIQGR